MLEVAIPELVNVTCSYGNDSSSSNGFSSVSKNSDVFSGANSGVSALGEQHSVQGSHTKDNNTQSAISAVAVIGKDKSSLGTMYTANGYGYAKDSNGRIVYACAESLRMALGEERVRDYKSQLTVGGKDRFLCDKDGNILPADGGHLFAVIFGGSPFKDNMVAMDRYINRSVYKRLENEWAKAIAEGYDVKVELYLPYTNSRERPDVIMATYTFTKDGQSDTQHFSITNDDPRQEEYNLTDGFEGYDSLAGLTDEQKQAYQEAYDYATSKVGKEIYSKESTTHIIHSDGSNITSYMGFTSKSENAGGSQDSSSKSIDDKE